MDGAFNGDRHAAAAGAAARPGPAAVWVLLLAVMPVGDRGQLLQALPDRASRCRWQRRPRQPVAGRVERPAVRRSRSARSPPGRSAAPRPSWSRLMSLLTVVRHTRAEEEAGRQELVGAAVVGRYAPLTAALLVAGAGQPRHRGPGRRSGLIGVGLPAAGSLAFGLATALVGIVFAAVGGGGRPAHPGRPGRPPGIGVAVLGAAFLLRAVGDTGAGLADLALADRLGACGCAPFAGEQWWVLALPVALSAVLHRGRVRAAVAAPGPRGRAAGRAARSGRGRAPHCAARSRWPGGCSGACSSAGWSALALSGAVLGGAAKGIGNATGLSDADERDADPDGRPRRPGRRVPGRRFGIIGLRRRRPTRVQATLRLRGEETGGRVEPLLATRGRPDLAGRSATWCSRWLGHGGAARSRPGPAPAWRTARRSRDVGGQLGTAGRRRAGAAAGGLGAGRPGPGRCSGSRPGWPA